VSPPGPTNQVELVAYHSRLIDDAGIDANALAAVAGGAKHAADPRQIIASRGSSRTLGTPAAYVIDE
jgi:hypothetical protein